MENCLILIINNYIYVLIFGPMKKYTLLFIALFIVSCSDNDDTELKPFYVADNGVTIKARDWVTSGTTGELNGVTYTAVDNALLKKMVGNNEDYSKIVTTLLSGKTSEVFNTGLSPTGAYNPSVDITTWDVSNITHLEGIFEHISNFNQDLNNWDTSSLVSMPGAFINAKNSNPKIDKWNVSNVTNMNATFFGSKGFNGDLSGWNVEKVTECTSFAFTGDFPKSKWPNFTNCSPD